jgi:toxin YoeB
VKIVFDDAVWNDYVYWQKTDRKVVLRINTLIKDICGSPFEGIGKPERLKHALSGFWSRRIDEVHRVVYTVEGDELRIAQLRYHY